MKLAAAILLVIGVGIAGGAISRSLGLRVEPVIHDEFAYLFQADTFLHGRLANPPPPLPNYFQTFHELTQPTYGAKFPPGQGLALAMGRLFGDPIVGAYGTVALACGAIVWLIRAWLPVRWAVFGGLLALTHPLVQQWSRNFWGGGVALLGGAVLIGAVLRGHRRPRVRYALLAAAGLSLLLISRPLEGVIVASLSAVWLAIGWRRQGHSPHSLLLPLLAGTLGLLPVFGFIAYDDYRVTGSAFELPHAYYAAHFQRAPELFFQSENTHVDPTNPRLASWRDGLEFAEYAKQRTLDGYLSTTGQKLRDIASNWIDPWPLVVLLLPLPWLLRYRRNRGVLLLTLGLPVVLLLITPWLRMHYLAPVAGGYFLLLTAGARAISRWKLGLFASFAVLLFTAYTSVSAIGQAIANPDAVGHARVQIIDQLSQYPGGQLVIVNYAPGPQRIFEWVFNDADLDAQKVIWARDLGPQTAAELRTRYPQRRFWRLDVRDSQIALNPLR